MSTDSVPVLTISTNSSLPELRTPSPFASPRIVPSGSAWISLITTLDGTTAHSVAAFGVGSPVHHVVARFSDISSLPAAPLPPVWVSEPSLRSSRCQVTPVACPPSAISACEAMAVSARYVEASVSASGPSIETPVLSTASAVSPQIA